MNTPSLDSPDSQERLQSAHDDGSSETADPEALQPLFRALRGEDLQVACDAAQALAALGDTSFVPRLLHEREAVRAELNAGDRLVDASEGRREMALTMAIISLLPSEECDTLLQKGDAFEKYMVRRKRTVASTEEFWGPIRE